MRAILNTGQRAGAHWLPAECDYDRRAGSIMRPEDDKVRSTENLLDLYFQSVGRGASLLLNLPPDRRGHSTHTMCARCWASGSAWAAIFCDDLARQVARGEQCPRQ